MRTGGRRASEERERERLEPIDTRLASRTFIGRRAGLSAGERVAVERVR